MNQNYTRTVCNQISREIFQMLTRSHILDLPNEIIYHCFDYLSFYEIQQSFRNLNIRFTHLITIHWSSIQIDSDVRKLQFECLLSNLNPTQIKSLHLSENDDQRHYVLQFLSRFPIETLKNLRSLKLNKLSQQSFHLIISNLHQLHKLSNLIILDIPEDNDEFLFEHLFSNQNPILKSLTLDGILYCDTTTIYSLSNIEILALNCYVDNVHHFLERTPKLKKLNLNLYELSNTNDIQTMNLDTNMFLCIPLTLSYLKIELRGNTDFYTMNTMMKLFKLNNTSLFQLEHLVISGEVHETLLDGQQWKQLIYHYLPSVKQFQFHFTVTNENNWNYIEYHVGDWITIDLDDILSTFKTDFWLNKHQWFVYGSTDDESTILYTLPYCETSSIYLGGSESTLSNYRTQITSPVVPYTYHYTQRIQELTLCISSDDDLSSRPYHYYFSHVIKLCLNSKEELQNIIELLSNVINLNNIQQLELSYPIQLDSVALSNLISHLPNLNTLCIWYKITGDFIFLNNIRNKSHFKHLEIRVRTQEDFRNILQMLKLNLYSLMLKVSVEEENFKENNREFISKWIREQLQLIDDNEISIDVLSIGEKTSWITIEFNSNHHLLQEII
ncbi:hypothetical protein I4U23_004892 [Adineta vaga]|nr:hypothetical protein I4U23_004892 [Adineta vaga]